MSVKSHAAAAAVLQLQLDQHLCKSIQNVKPPLCTKFGKNECITSQNIQHAALYLKKNTAAAAAVLQLQQQNLFELIQNIKLRMCTRFTENK